MIADCLELLKLYCYKVEYFAVTETAKLFKNLIQMFIKTSELLFC